MKKADRKSLENNLASIKGKIGTIGSNGIISKNHILIGSRDWYAIDGLSIYIRINGRHYKDNKILAITIANVSVRNPRKQGRGLFTKFLESIEAYGLPVMVENPIEKRFQLFLARKGYVKMAEGEQNNWIKVVLPEEEV